MTFGARAVIRLGALEHNFAILRKAARGANVCAVIKANAFGHGLLAVAGALPDAGSFAVARLREAEILRAGGIRQPLVLLPGVMSEAELDAGLGSGCELVVHNPAQLELLESRGHGSAVVWLKVETGMHRLGIEFADVPAALRRLARCTAVREVRLMTHLAKADERDEPFTATQVQRFRALLRDFDGAISIANSAALLGWGELIASIVDDASRVWVRPGIALYGISPFPGQCGRDLGLQPVMQFESRLIAIKPVAAGEAVGYGGNWVAPADTRIGIVSAGYGDGYSRFLPNGTPVLVNGRRVPLVGTVSMDMAAVDLGPGGEEGVGDAVILWGDELPAEEVARHAGTIAYQLVCGVTHRDSSAVVPRRAARLSS